jgi:hypothetical protein
MRFALLIPVLAASVSAWGAVGPEPIDRYRPGVVAEVAGIATDPQVQERARSRGLAVLNLTWEDTGRSKGSSIGPNISDLTIQPIGAGAGDPLLPVIRFPNFADLTADVRIDDIALLVGNQNGGALQPITLRQYLRGFASFQHSPTGRLGGDLLAARDEVVLASAQACLLPVPAGGSVRFAPVLFNYQSQAGQPAVLVILATPEGTSAQVVTNNPALGTGRAWGQRLFHNRAGQRAGLAASRFSDSASEVAAGGGRPATGDRADGLSCVLVIQVPLVVPEPVWRDGLAKAANGPAAPCCAADESSARRGMEQAVVSSGPVEGPWIGLDGCTIRRDERFPIRVTVQFYQATDTGQVTESDLDRISRTLHRVYAQAETVGSLVTAGWTGRPTEHQGPAVPPVPPVVWPQPWYAGPCRSYEAATGRTWQDGIDRIRRRLGADWQPVDVRELRNALALVRE